MEQQKHICDKLEIEIKVVVPKLDLIIEKLQELSELLSEDE